MDSCTRTKAGFFTQEGYEDYPVIEVSWYGAAAYCAWAEVVYQPKPNGNLLRVDRRQIVILGESPLVVRLIWQEMVGNGSMMGGHMNNLQIHQFVPLLDRVKALFALPEVVLGLMKAGK